MVVKRHPATPVVDFLSLLLIAVGKSDVGKEAMCYNMHVIGPMDHEISDLFSHTPRPHACFTHPQYPAAIMGCKLGV